MNEYYRYNGTGKIEVLTKTEVSNHRPRLEFRYMTHAEIKQFMKQSHKQRG